MTLPELGSRPIFPSQDLDLSSPTGVFTGMPGARVIEPERGPLWWVNTEYLMWWVRSGSLPPLVQSIPIELSGATDFDPSSATQVYPNGSLNPGMFSGLRMTAGLWFDPSQSSGFEVSGFWLPEKTSTFQIASDGSNVIGRSVTDVTSGAIRFLQMTFPGTVVGGIATEYETKLYGGEGNFLYSGPDGILGTDRIDWLLGFRYLNFEERFRITDTAGSPAVGISLSSYDEFLTRNQFYGGQVGARFNWGTCDSVWTSNLTLKFALGGMVSDASADGRTELRGTQAFPVSAPGGLLALPSNIGEVSKSRTVFIPELTWNIGFRPSKHTTLFFGYNFMYLTDVLRPGGVIDTTINTNLIPFVSNSPLLTPTRPGLRSEFSDLWVQGMMLGFSLEY